MEELKKEVRNASLGILLALLVLKHLGGLVPPIASYAFTAAAAIQLYVPLFLVGKRGLTREGLGLDRGRWLDSVLLALGLGLLTIVPFAIGHHFWQTELFHRRFELRLADGLFTSIVTQLLAVALPEELFFRGYLQGRMELLWPASRRVFGVPFGKAILVASAVFALAHFVGEYRPDRLGPFFPALVFGLLRTKTQSIVAPVTYHAFCNILSEMLFACYS
ncbi:MAG: CPBP family intramembrane glutamic endopeptidase [Myxococcota bacterium]